MEGNMCATRSLWQLLDNYRASMVASAGETDWDLAGRQFPRNRLPYNIIEFKYFKFKLYNVL
jgi:hypothetical protein